MFTGKACLIAGSLTFFAWGAALQKPLRKSKANHHDQLFADGDPSRSVNSTCDLSHSGLPDFASQRLALHSQLTKLANNASKSLVIAPVGCYLTASPHRVGGRYSHSIVAGGLPEMSYTTRLMPRTSLMMRLETLPSSACGSSAQCAVMKSCVCTARSATTHS